MRITVFTSNQPRHASLIASLTGIAETVYAVQECNTVFPGQIKDFFNKSDAMQRYFKNVMAAEKKIFGDVRFSSERVRSLPIKSGDLNLLNESQLAEALNSDFYVVFGASYIQGWLIDALVKRNAINIHMGVSPYYRGSSCNFWALYDDKPSHVGATIHRLSQGLDSGEMYFHCMPSVAEDGTLFDFTMRSVDAAHKALVARIADGSIFDGKPIPQNKTREIRYTRNRDFTDKVAQEFLERSEGRRIRDLKINYPDLLDPFFT